MFNSRQIIETIDQGLFVLDRDLIVRAWNRWMVLHSGISAHDVIGRSIYTIYPHLDGPKFNRFFKSVFSFGNYAYFSQKLHKYLLPMKNTHSTMEDMPFMQQNCTAGPLRDEQGVVENIFVTILDVTGYVAYEQKLIEMGKLDYLTKLYNRSYLDKRLVEELERARRYGNALSIFMIDIDHFKKINDDRGHLCGDHTLRELAMLLQQVVRTMDVVGRYGGEEFCCVLPETTGGNACMLAERLREIVEQTEIAWGDSIFGITISIGVAGYGDGAESLEKLIDAADRALYQAKHLGRNRVVHS